MVDHVGREKRSEIMRAVQTKNGRLELRVRSALHRMGYRFRLHTKELPGTPDIVLPRHRVVVFVHGCYWHRHGCRKSTTPKTNREFWHAKFERNIERDAAVAKRLKATGWKVVVVWQCEAPTVDAAVETLRDRLVTGEGDKLGKDLGLR